MNEELESDYLPTRPNYFESPEAIARHILEHEHNPTGVVNADSPRANLNPGEMRSARVLGDLIGDIEFAERICGWDLFEPKIYIQNKLATTNVPSRSKDGFAIVLSKTDRNVQTQTLENFATDISQHFDENTEQGLLNKIPLLGGLVKKKQDGAIING